MARIESELGCNQENQGRRIEKCDGGWKILNGEYYRRKMSEDDRREYQKLYHRDYRKKLKRVATKTVTERVLDEAARNGDDYTAERIDRIATGQPPTLSDHLGGPDA